MVQLIRNSFWGLVCFSLISPSTALLFGASEGSPGSSGNTDRQESAGGASGAALAAAALAQVMCLKMMADAQREGNSEKMAMAAAMCAQAAANAANAEENKKSAEKASSGIGDLSVPTMGSGSPQASSSGGNEDLALGKQSKSSNSGSSVKSTDSPVPSFSSPAPTENGTVFTEDKKFMAQTSPLSPSSAKDFETTNVSLRESNNSNSGAGKPFTNLSANNLPGQTNANELFKSGASSAASSSSGDSKTKSTSSKGEASQSTEGMDGSNYDDMISRYMAGATGAGTFSAYAGGGLIDLAQGLQVPGQRPKTIFEFATEQYQKVKTSGRALTKHSPLIKPKEPGPSRQIASQP